MHDPDTPETLEDALRRAVEEPTAPLADIARARAIGVLAGLAVVAILAGFVALILAIRGGA